MMDGSGPRRLGGVRPLQEAMTEEFQSKTGKIPLKSFLHDFRSPVTDAELKEKYHLSARNLFNLIKALLEKGLVTADDLAWRKNMAVRRDLAKQSEFLSGLYICPHCSHPHPSPFRICPACGGDTGDAFNAQEMLQAIFSTEVHDAVSEQEAPPVDETQLLDPSEMPGSKADEERREARDSQPRRSKETEESKASARNTVRSLISKLKKK